MNNFENILNQNPNSPGAEITLIDQQSLNPLTGQLDKLSGRAGGSSETPLLPNNLEDIKLTQKLSDIGVIPSSQLPYLQNQEVNSYLLTDEPDQLLVGDLNSVKLSSVADNYPTVLSALSPSLTPTISQNSISAVVPLVGDTFVVPGKTSEFTKLSFKWTQRDAAFNNEIGVFVIDELGRVNGVAPGEINYAQVALQSATRQVIFSRGQSAGTHKEFTFKAGERLAFYLIQDSTTEQWLASNPQNQVGAGPVAFFSLSNANPDQIDHVLTQTLDNGSMKLNWEDMTGGGDRDFNDVVFTIAESRRAITVPGQRGQKVTTKFTWTQRDAAFNNELGLFIVDDPTGRIGNLLPQDPGYAQAALTSKSRQVVFASGQTQGYAKNLELPSQAYIGFYLIQNSTSEQFLSQNPQNQIHQGPSAFFFFPSANPNQFDHIIEVSSNQLAWEDQTNGGDRDYNDLVFHYEFGSPVDAELLSPTLDLASESDSGVSNSDNITSDNTPTITGNAEVGAKVQLYSGSVLLGQTTADTAGIWQITTNELNHGTQNFSAIATDIAGNISPTSSPLNIFIDTINPIINLTNPIDIAPLQKGARLTGKIDGTGSGIASLSYRFDNYPEIPLAFNADGIFDQEIDFTNIANGGYKLSIIAIDIAGNSTNTQFNINIANSNVGENSAPEIISQPETDYIIMRNSNTQIQGIALDTTQAGLAEIQGQAFLDFDRNGIKNLEAGLDGFVVELVNSGTDEVVGMQVTRSVDINNDGKIDPFTEQGLYKFSNLQAGNYQVRQVTQDAWNLTSPALPIYNLTLNNGESKDGLNFGNAQNYFYQLQAIDGDGDSLSYSLISAPQDAKIDANTGKLIWTPPATGEYTFQVQVVDGKGGEDIQEFKLNVIDPNRLPSISSSPSANATVEENYTYQIIADNPDLDGLNFQLNQAPQGMTISPDGLIQWTLQANQVGAQQVKLLVRDDRGGEVEQVFTILTQEKLANPQPSNNYAPVITSKPAIAAAINQQYIYDVDAIDGDNDPLQYSLLTAPQGMIIDENTGLISWNTNSQIAEDYNINVQVADGKGGVDNQTFTLTLSNTVPGEISGIVWDDFNGNGIRDTSFAQGANPDIVFVFDVSLSTAFSFQGSVNGNQKFTTILEAEIAGLNALNQQLIRQGLGETARVSIVSFAGDVSSIDMNPSLDGTQLVTNPIADNDHNGVLDFEQVIERTNIR
ncbi:DUF4114 domain-containing protein, partial [Calothrix sp. FACHB-156]|nr:DUF4114 domain-containing protein [Calothrix sp. FACHB-156]